MSDRVDKSRVPAPPPPSRPETAHPSSLSTGQPDPRSDPRKPLGVFGKCMAALIALVSALYLVAPTLGIFELLPDALPIVGNLDEAFFTLALASALAALGFELPFLRRR